MRILVFEYLSTGACAEHPSARELADEGLAMLTAVVADLTRCPGVEVVTMVHPTLQEQLQLQASAALIHLVTPGQEEVLFRRLARTCTHALVIAPESDDLLEHYAAVVLSENGSLLGSTPQGIHLAADKLHLAQHLQQHRILTPLTVPYQPGSCSFSGPVVVKPRFGAGCQATFLVSSSDQYDQVGRLALNEGFTGPLIAQPLAGDPQDLHASVTFLLGPSICLPLPAGQQLLDTSQPRWSYTGGILPLDSLFHARAVDLASKAVASIPGLQGYVGVDLILSRADPSLDTVIEINPRLTTSYVGLRRLARFNIMQAMLEVLAGIDPRPLDYHPFKISFAALGSLEEGSTS